MIIYASTRNTSIDSFIGTDIWVKTIVSGSLTVYAKFISCDSDGIVTFSAVPARMCRGGFLHCDDTMQAATIMATYRSNRSDLSIVTPIDCYTEDEFFIVDEV